MTTHSYCDNCNHECRPRTVQICWSEWEDMAESQLRIRGLCEDCSWMLAELDFAGLVEAHATRRRVVELP